MNKHLATTTTWALAAIAAALLTPAVAARRDPGQRQCAGDAGRAVRIPDRPRRQPADLRLEPPELSVTVPVRPDGMISTPLVENMVADGKTPSQLARDMEKALAEYVRTPTVNVIVTTFVGTYGDSIRVVGQATDAAVAAVPGEHDRARRHDRSGGLAEFAAETAPTSSGARATRKVKVPVRLNSLLNSGDTSANVLMRPGDVLIIPESRF